MRALKHIAGILLATVGILFSIGGIVFIVAPDPDIPRWGAAIMFVILGLLPLGGAFVLLRSTITAPCKSCPQCGGTERHPAGVVRSSVNLWLFVFFGWFFSSLWGTSRERQFRCAQCENLYMSATKGTRIAGVLLWVFLLLVLFSIIAQQFEGR